MACAVANAAPRVLVLLAARNGAQWIERQLATVLAQEGVDVVVDVRDDGSTDATRRLVEAMAARDRRVRLRADHVPSGSAAGNFFRLIAGPAPDDADLVAFCDQDDEWNPDKLARAARRLALDKAAGYSGAVLARWPDGSERVLGQDPHTTDADFLFEGAGQGCTFVMTAALFARVQSALQAGADLLGGIHYHDWAIYAVARAHGLQWTFDPEPVMTYRQHGGNDTGARTSTGGIWRRLAAIRSGWYRRQVLAISSLVLRVAPDDAAARRWLALDGKGLPARLGRVRHLATHGRRRRSDRCVQIVAALCGWL